MRLTVLGCSGSLPGPKSPASSYLVEADGFRVLLDLGNGALGAFQEHAKIADIDAVLLSHLHPDHCLDLCSLYVARRFWPDVEGPPIPVWGPPDTAARMAAAYGLAPEPAMAKTFDFRTYLDGPFAVGPVEVRAARPSGPRVCPPGRARRPLCRVFGGHGADAGIGGHRLRCRRIPL